MKTSEWLKTSDPVVAVSAPIPSAVLSALREALNDGVNAIPDLKRSCFYDIQIGSRWYYIHVRRHLSRVYVIATGRIALPGGLTDPASSRICIYQ
jgi:hypothetical protein